MNILGLDACRMGWCAVGVVNNKFCYACFEDLNQLLETYPNLNRILIDIPIGLSSTHFKRTVDTQARTFLDKRKSSIFSPPSREALSADNYKEALAINRTIEGKGISIQAYNIGAKIKEVDDWYATKPEQLQIYEAHPELCFKTLHQGRDLEHSKHEKKGIELRQHIIFQQEYALKKVYDHLMLTYKRNQLKPDDILDAMALYLINRMSEKLKVVTDDNTIDETGKKVGIVYG